MASSVSGADTVHSLRAFGLEIESDYPLTGSVPVAATDCGSSAPTTHVRSATSEQLELVWEQPTRRLYQAGESATDPSYTIDVSETGYLFWLEGQGRYVSSLDGATVAYEGGTGDSDGRERFLLAQALPVASLMNGYEVLHASAVCRQGAAAAFTGVSGMGKTSLASRLIARGDELLSDDVLAIERHGSAVLAHPGPRFMAIREEDLCSIGDSEQRLGERVGVTDKVHVAPAGHALPTELKAIYHLEPGPSFEILPLKPAEFNRNLGSVFAPYVMTPRRLSGHLEMAQVLSASVAQFRLLSPRTGVTQAMIEALSRHLTMVGV